MKQSLHVLDLFPWTPFPLYPTDTWIHIYTEGSSKDNGASGCDAYCKDLFKISLSDGQEASNFNAEKKGNKAQLYLI